IHGYALATTTLARDRFDSMHLLKQGALIFGFRLGQGITQLDERGRIVNQCAHTQRWCIDFGEHYTKESLLFGNNRRRAGAGRFDLLYIAVLVDFVLHDLHDKVV
ncbi:MAG TPA: hypothetical protein VF550_09780, partial [Polyangia bacterium]